MAQVHEVRRSAGVDIPANWRERATISVPEYAAILGIGIKTAYRAVQAAEVVVIRQRGRILVCVPALLRQLEGGVTPGKSAAGTA
jgi:hypothetical protein